MAEVVQRIWRSGPRKVKRSACGYMLQVDGTQERKFSSGWTRDDAEKALAVRILERDAPKASTPVMRTLVQLATEYLDF